ncbi:hypothetical protein POTOM_050633 [Populus tomentosa]|uniref:C2H2-type domain-containing protein n=1 Tax=Populus tomentosa TaxID=118781 RepID=A0A8X8C882_POPTO|nr:hypothetical protein POTOM_050633 [Populus tomentosa]
MGKATRITQILFLISLLSKQILSQDVGEHVAARTVKQEEGHAHKVHCSRERSRAAWQAIEEYLMPFVEREPYQISSKCRLHPSNDLFRDQEEHKIHVDINEWKCGYCKKHFRAEKYLDQHFDNRHYNLLNISDGKCLADLCGALHCDFMMDSKSTKTKCNPAAVAKNRHLCESLADSCFPLNQGPSASRLHGNEDNCFCTNFVMLILAQGKETFFLRVARYKFFMLSYLLAFLLFLFVQKKTSVFYLAISILTMMMIPLFYLIVYLHQSEMRTGTQQLRRIPKVGKKTKPS